MLKKLLKLLEFQKIMLNKFLLLLRQTSFEKSIKNTSVFYSTQSSIYIFDRNVKRQQRDRAVNDPDYKQYEYVKSEVGYRVADRIFDIKRSFNNILDLGCQRGYVSKHLTKVKIKSVKSNKENKIL